MPTRDWEFSPDGDLVLGDPRVDAEGNILYINIDRTVTTEPTEQSKPIRDISYLSGQEAELQIVKNRLRTDSPDWFHHPKMGGNLTDLIGEQNTREVGQRGAASIFEALTYDGLYSRPDVSVRPVPINAQSILFMIEINSYGSLNRYPFIFELEKGLLDYYEIEREEPIQEDVYYDELPETEVEEGQISEEIFPEVEEADAYEIPEEYVSELPDAEDIDDGTGEFDDGMPDGTEPPAGDI